MNIKALLKLAVNYNTIEINRQVSEMQMLLGNLALAREHLSAYAKHLQAVQDGKHAPTLDLNIAQKATEVAVNETRLFHLYLDLATSLKVQGATDPCLDV